MASSSQSVQIDDPKFEEIALAWFNDLESDEEEELVEDLIQDDSTRTELEMSSSDESGKNCDSSENQNANITEEINEVEEHEDDENIKDFSSISKQKAFYGRDRFKWSSTPIKVNKKRSTEETVSNGSVLRKRPFQMVIYTYFKKQKSTC
ncbi:hypothetical protein QE152_g22653 [Popillia japonica]|uniref:Uncharacterized protein n=1 Tax=Popillia japonica TaxID=7064 RepID=A0AAW1KJV8_POPJA